jgi:GNAT superfamily N-acetyltransferase
LALTLAATGGESVEVTAAELRSELFAAVGPDDREVTVEERSEPRSATQRSSSTYDCAPTVFLEAVVVATRYRRQGIATAIVQQVLADANAAGCNKVQLLSHKRHATDGAHHLYAGLGFEAEAEGFRLYLQGAPRSHLASGGDDEVGAT